MVPSIQVDVTIALTLSEKPEFAQIAPPRSLIRTLAKFMLVKLTLGAFTICDGVGETVSVRIVKVAGVKML